MREHKEFGSFLWTPQETMWSCLYGRGPCYKAWLDYNLDRSHKTRSFCAVPNVDAGIRCHADGWLNEACVFVQIHAHLNMVRKRWWVANVCVRNRAFGQVNVS